MGQGKGALTAAELHEDLTQRFIREILEARQLAPMNAAACALVASRAVLAAVAEITPSTAIEFRELTMPLIEQLVGLMVDDAREAVEAELRLRSRPS